MRGEGGTNFCPPNPSSPSFHSLAINAGHYRGTHSLAVGCLYQVRMDAKVSQRFQLLTCIDSKKVAPRLSSLLLVSRRTGEKKLQIFASPLNKEKNVFSGVSCSYKSNPDEALILKNKSEAIGPHLNGRCIYLVGMMGSGKTTVGKILSQVLRYSFCDCDTFVEEEVGTSVADIFKLYGEGVFREKESEALRKLSLMHHLVVSTGGGAIIRPINLKYMQKGISVLLDVPLEALAHRIVAAGTGSRPLLHHDSGDAYAKALLRLSYLFEERRDAYAQTNAKVSLENIAAKLGCRDVLTVSPAAIALEALEQIGGFLKREDGCFSV